MARIKGAMMTRKRRNKVLKAAKGYWGAKSKHFKMAKQAVMKSGNYAFAGRKMKKRYARSTVCGNLSSSSFCLRKRSYRSSLRLALPS